HGNIAAMKRGIKSGASGQREGRVQVPQGDNDVGVDRGCHCDWMRSVDVTAQFAQPSIDRLLAGWDSGIADTAVLLEYTLAANRPDMHSVAVALKQQAVALANAKEAADFDRNGDLAFARDFCLLLHSKFRFLTLAYIPYFGQFRDGVHYRWGLSRRFGGPTSQKAREVAHPARDGPKLR